MVSPIRFAGMASGLDTEKMIKELMNAQRAPVNKLKKNKITQEWKRDAYREMNKLLLELQTSVNSLRYSADFNKKLATSENDGIAAAKVTGKPSLSSYAIEVKQLARAEMPAAAQFTVDPSITSTSSTVSSAFDITVNGVTVNVAAGESVSAIINKINSSSAGVTASLVNGKFVFNSKTGATLTADVDGNAVNGNEGFTVKASGVNQLGIGTTDTNSTARVAGQSAKAVINGIEYTSTTNTLSFDGIDFTLKQTNIGSPITVSVKTDEDAIFNSIKSFVDKYNEVIEKVNTKISEPRYKGYEPLLDEEKEALPEKTADKLEAMARSGILLRDTTLKTGLDKMRYAIAAPVQGLDANFDTLSEIGIGGPPSGKFAYMENGKLYIDETKLRTAIRENGDKVTALFTNFSNDPDPATKYKQTGIAERLYDQLSTTINEVTTKAGSSTNPIDDSDIAKSIKRIDDEIETWEDRLQQIEDRYWKQFTAMEKAIQQYNSQGSWYAQMLSQN